MRYFYLLAIVVTIMLSSCSKDTGDSWVYFPPFKTPVSLLYDGYPINFTVDQTSNLPGPLSTNLIINCKNGNTQLSITVAGQNYVSGQYYGNINLSGTLYPGLDTLTTKSGTVYFTVQNNYPNAAIVSFTGSLTDAFNITHNITRGSFLAPSN